MTNRYFQYWTEKEKREAKAKEVADQLKQRTKESSPLSQFVGWSKNVPSQSLTQTLGDIGSGFIRGSSEPIPTLRPLVQKLPEGLPQEIAGSLASPIGLASLAAAPFTGGGTLAARLGAGAIGKSLATEAALNIGGVVGAHAASAALPEDAPGFLKVGLPLAAGAVAGGGLAAGIGVGTKSAAKALPTALKIDDLLPGDQLYKLVFNEPNALRNIVDNSPSLVKGPLGKTIRAFDPTALDLNSTEGQLKAFFAVHARQQDAGANFVNGAMAKIKAAGEVLPMSEDGLFQGWTTPLPSGMSRHINDVMENLPKYQPYMDQGSYQSMSMMKDAVSQMWDILKSRGIDLKDVETSMAPGKDFFPRIVKTLHEVAVDKDTPSYRFSGRNRVFVDAADAMALSDTKYFHPETVTEAYLRAGYNLIADQELSTMLMDKFPNFAPKDLIPQNLRDADRFAKKSQLRAKRGLLKAQESGDVNRIQQSQLKFDMAQELKSKTGSDIRKAIENIKSGPQVVSGSLVAKTGMEEGDVLRIGQLGKVPGPLVGKMFPEDVIQGIEKNVKDVASRWDSPGFMPKVITGLEKVNVASRTTKLGFDFARPFIQDLVTLARFPAVWAKQTVSMFREAATPGWASKYLADPESQDVIHRLVPYGMIISGQGRKATEVGESLSAVKKITGPFGGVFNRMQGMFEVPGDVGRIEIGKSLLPLAKSEKDLYDLAQYANEMTGVLSSKAIGIGAGQRQLENTFIFLAPRYRRAAAALVSDAVSGVADIVKANVSLFDPKVRESLSFRHMQALRSLTQLTAGAGLMYTALGDLVGESPDFDPRSGRFMTLKVGNTHVGLGTAYLTMLRLIGSGVATSQNNPEDLVKFWDFDKNPLLRTFRYGTSPSTGLALDILSGKTAVGRPLDTPIEKALQVPRGLTPVVLEAALWDRSGTTAIAGEMGGAREFPISVKEARDRAVQERKIVIDSGFQKGQVAKSYNDLPEGQQRMIDSLPEVSEIVSRQRVEPGTGLAYKQESQKLGEERKQVMTAIDKHFLVDTKDPQGWRDQRSQYLTAVGQQYADLRDKYASVIDGFEKSDNPDQVLLAEWYDIFSDPAVRDPETKQMNFDVLQQKIDDFKKEHGQEGMDYIEKNTGFYQSPAEMEYSKDKEKLKDYWDIADKVFSRVRNQHFELRKYSDYQEATTAADFDPQLRSSEGWREVTKAVTQAHKDYLDTHPQIKVLLIKWGYKDITAADIGMTEEPQGKSKLWGYS